MTAKLALSLIAAAFGLALLTSACGLPGFGGGGGSKSLVTAGRPGSIPTATPPANLPAPILLGESQGVSTVTAGSAASGSYTVKSGDTLGSIAAQAGVPSAQQAAWIADVLRLNGIDDARLLQPGQELQLPRVPTPPAGAATTTTGTPAGSTPSATGTTGANPTATFTGSAATATPRPSATTTSGGTGGGSTYTVQSGDYPYLIAGKLGVPDAQQAAWVSQLVSINNIDPSGLSVGQVLQLPPNTPGR